MPLSTSELEGFLEKPRMAHLATSSRDGKPRVTPIWYLYENGAFYFTTRLRRFKGRQILENDSVSLSIANEEHPYVAVCAFGKAEVVTEGRDLLLPRISSRYEEREEVERWFSKVTRQPDRVVMVVKPERIMSWHYGRNDAERQDQGESMTTEP